MKIVDRIYLFIKSKSLSLSEFDRSIGVANGYIGKQLKKGASIGSHIIEKIIYAHPDLSVRWLMTGEGHMLNSPDNESFVHEHLTYESDESDLFVVNMDSSAVSSIAETLEASTNSERIDSSIFSLNEEFIANNHFKNENYLCVKYTGEGMLPNVKSGTYMIIKKNIQSDSGFSEECNSLLVTHSNEIFFGKIIHIVENEWVIISRENPDKEKFPNIRIEIEDIASFWCVIGYMFALPEDISPESDYLEPINAMERKIESLSKELDKLKNMMGGKGGIISS